MWLLYYLKLKWPVDWVTQSRLVLLCLVLGTSHFHVRYEVSACYVCNLCLLTPQVNPALVVNINFVKPKSTKSDAKNASANQKTVYHEQQLSADDLIFINLFIESSHLQAFLLRYHPLAPDMHPQLSIHLTLLIHQQLLIYLQLLIRL